MAIAKIKAKGARGSWFAEVAGEKLPCVHQYWVKGTHHCDPNFLLEEPKWIELVRAIEADPRVILTKDEAYSAPEKKGRLAFRRKGYIAVFSVKNLVADEEGLKFDLNERLFDLQG